MSHQIIAAFIMGSASGCLVTMLLGIYWARKEQAAKIEWAAQLADKIKKEMIWASARQKFDKASAITEQQYQIISNMEGPSKGALFSRWRNDVRNQLLEMEREKMDIFRSILADGLDPIVNIIGDDGEVTKKKMSETVAAFDKAFPKELPSKNPSARPTPLKLIKLPTDTE